jgi:hypothetical protein
VHDGRVRAVRIALAGLLGLAGALIGAPAAFAANANISLDPAHGGARATITVTYQFTAFVGNQCPLPRARVVFGWDGNAVGQSRLNRDTCSVRVRLQPPRARNDPGQHRVTALIPTVAGSQANTVFTIDGTAPSPTRAQQLPTAAPADQTTTLPVDPSAVVDSALPAPGGSVAATAAAANVQAPWVSWALVFGGVLVLAGAGTLGMVIVRSRRERSEY